MGNILYEKWVFLITQKVWVQGKGVYLPIVLYLYNSKIKVPLNYDYLNALTRTSVSVIFGPGGRQESVGDKKVPFKGSFKPKRRDPGRALGGS